MSTHPRPRFTRTGAILCCVAVALVGCGGDDDDAGTAEEASASETTDGPASAETTAAPTTVPTTTATTSATTDPEPTVAPETTAAATGDGDGEPVSLDEPAVCTPYLAVSAALAGEPDPATIGPLLDEVDAATPDEIADQLAMMTGGARTVLETGDFSVFESPEFGAAVGDVEGWMFENCAFTTTAEITATEYEYTGMSDTYPAGRAAFRLVNAGAQAHEIMVLRKNDGVELSLEELLALPESEAETMTMYVGSAFVGPSGAESTLVADLEPGDYMAVCTIPDGTVVAADGSFTEGTGEPHVMLGMSFEFSVA